MDSVAKFHLSRLAQSLRENLSENELTLWIETIQRFAKWRCQDCKYAVIPLINPLSWLHTNRATCPRCEGQILPDYRSYCRLASTKPVSISSEEWETVSALQAFLSDNTVEMPRRGKSKIIKPWTKGIRR